MFRILCIFAMWIGWSSYQLTRGKSVAPSINFMTDTIKRTDNMAKKKSLEEVKQAFEKVWGDRYVYDLITTDNYKNMSTKVPVVCKEHGLFEVTPYLHANGVGCKYCGRNRQGIGARLDQRKKICGVGINDSLSPISVHRKRKKSYGIWKSMLCRCYDEECKKKYPTYIGCTVCDDWKYFSKFEEWFDKNYVKGYHLDKDLLVKGNKVYSPNTCCFVPPEINTLIVKHDATRGNDPIGVSKRKGANKYRAIVRLDGKYTQLGVYDTQKEAFEAYKVAKEAHIQEKAKTYYQEGKIAKNVYDALMNYKVEITD